MACVSFVSERLFLASLMKNIYLKQNQGLIEKLKNKKLTRAQTKKLVNGSFKKQDVRFE